MSDLLLPADELFWDKVDKNGPVPIERPELGACWRWTAAVTNDGYAAFNYYKPDGHRTRDSAHTWAYRRYVGPIPDGHQLDHLCHTVDVEHCNLRELCPHRACVNYERHLQPTTPAQNTMRSRSWAATKKRQVVCLRGHLLVGPNLIQWFLIRGHRACKSCQSAHQTKYRVLHKDPQATFDVQAESDLIYNRLMNIIPEQSTPRSET